MPSAMRFRKWLGLITAGLGLLMVILPNIYSKLSSISFQISGYNITLVSIVLVVIGAVMWWDYRGS